MQQPEDGSDNFNRTLEIEQKEFEILNLVQNSAFEEKIASCKNFLDIFCLCPASTLCTPQLSTTVRYIANNYEKNGSGCWKN